MPNAIPCVFLAWIVTLGFAQGASGAGAPEGTRLEPPATGPIRVAFLLSGGATVIDFAGPWEVFQDVSVPGRGDGGHDDMQPFVLYTVAATRDPIVASAGMRIVPDHTFDDAPQPQVIVVPAQSGSEAGVAWLRKAAPGADMTMSVCTGAFQLARAGLLDGRKATTHHEFYDEFARAHPRIDVQRGLRWVDGPRVATAGGLTSGIDMALRIVARYFGDDVAERTARYMEHRSDDWRAQAGLWDGSTAEEAAREAERRSALGALPVLRGMDPVLLSRGEEAKGRADLVAEDAGLTYAFATESTRDEFVHDPGSFRIQLAGACAMMASAGAPPGSGDPDRYLVHEGRIYVFATESCREAFAAAPDRYVP